MAFCEHQRTNQGCTPMEELPAAAGAYDVGTLLEFNSGKLRAVSGASTTTPPYICMQQRTVGPLAPDNMLLVAPVVPYDVIYETEIGTTSASLTIGEKLQVEAGGKAVNKTAPGTFELLWSEEYTTGATGTKVHGRFVAGAK